MQTKTVEQLRNEIIENGLKWMHATQEKVPFEYNLKKHHKIAHFYTIHVEALRELVELLDKKDK